MKRTKNLYNKITDIKCIQEMYEKRVKRTTKNKLKLEKFEQTYVSNIIYIKQILENKTYVPGKYNIFLVREPKLRIIMSQNIIDKLINHLVSYYFLREMFENKLINENIATRENKGTHYGIKLIKKYINELKDKKFYILKFDISKYFYNLDHEIIKKLITMRTKDIDVINMLNKIIDSTNEQYVNERINKLKKQEIERIKQGSMPNKEEKIKEVERLPLYQKGKGLPIGNMSSQILAITYLNELDHFIKEDLKIKHYVRYMDDGILLCENKKYLCYCLTKISEKISEYGLKLNNKTKIYKIDEGFEFLGFRFLIKNNKLIMKVKNQTKKKFKRKMKTMNKLLSENKLDRKYYLQVRASYLGHLKHGNCQNLINSTLNKYESKINIESLIDDKGVIL